MNGAWGGGLVVTEAYGLSLFVTNGPYLARVPAHSREQHQGQELACRK